MGQGARLSGGTKAGGLAGFLRNDCWVTPDNHPSAPWGEWPPSVTCPYSHSGGGHCVHAAQDMSKCGGPWGGKEDLSPPSHRWAVAWNDPSPQGNSQREVTPQKERRACFGNECWAAKNAQTCTLPAHDHELARDRNAHETVSKSHSELSLYLCFIHLSLFP